MSQYINFFLRCEDTFCPIGSFSRSSSVYRNFTDNIHIPYEKITPINKTQLEYIQNSIRTDQINAERLIKNQEEQINLILRMNNSVTDKLDAIDVCNDAIKSDREEMKYEDYAADFCDFLSTIINDIAYDDRFTEAKADNYIYAGIEIGRPTVDDVERD